MVRLGAGLGLAYWLGWACAFCRAWAEFWPGVRSCGGCGRAFRRVVGGHVLKDRREGFLPDGLCLRGCGGVVRYFATGRRPRAFGVAAALDPGNAAHGVLPLRDVLRTVRLLVLPWAAIWVRPHVR